MNSLSDEPGPVPSSAPDVLPQEIAPGPPPMPPSSAKEPAGPDQVLLALREQLQELRQRFEATDAQIAGYLRDQAGPPRGSEANGEALAHVQHSVDRLLSKFEALLTSKSEPAAASGQAPAKGQQDVLDAVQKLAEHQSHLAGKIVNTLAKKMMEELDLLRFQKVVHETLATELDRREADAKGKAEEALAASEVEIELENVELEDDVPPEEDASVLAWSQAIWGPELVFSEGFAPFLSELNRRLLAGDPGVATLAGQILLFRQSPPEAKPQLLKDVGEAYYRTRIDAAMPRHPFEHALIDWLQSECEQAGLKNTIEVVHAGERFDKSRHSSTTKGGAEVADVFGWVVLTEGGRVYTRASVAAH